MSQLTIQQQFDRYLELLGKMHGLGHDIDASITENDIEDFRWKRTKYRNQVYNLISELTESLKKMGAKYPVSNQLTGQLTYIYEDNGQLMFEFPRMEKPRPETA
ncbi:hypothetical protein ACTJKC_02610 [Pedobacter sp. 22226]|uniref:hypothetical protein n=1 Tax=Pedobacter sp. 22226 TaxID=3453894 RepID=UPI003F86CADB